MRGGSAQYAATVLRTSDLTRAVYYPSSLTVTAGTLAAGVVADVAVIGGNNIHIDEVGSTPGYDIIFEFTAVVGVPRWAHVIGYYNGNHAPKIQAYDYAGAAWLTLETIIDSGGAQDMHSYLLPLDERCASAGAMRLRFYHAANGSTSHDLYVDYVVVTTWRT
jgi:hypothetical protein